MEQIPLPTRDFQPVPKWRGWDDATLEKKPGLRKAIFDALEDSRRGKNDGVWAHTLHMSASHFSRCKTSHHFPTDKIADAIRKSANYGPLQYLFLACGSPPDFARWAAKRCGLPLEDNERQRRIDALKAELQELEATG